MSVSVPFQIARDHFELGDEEEHRCADDHHDHGHGHNHAHNHGHDCEHDHDHDHDYDHGFEKNGAVRKRPHLHDHNHTHSHGGCAHDHSGDGWRKYLPHSHGLETRLQADARSLSLALFILVTACLTQLVGGLLANSSVLRVEALHSALDGVTVVISLVSVIVAARAPTPRYSYGLSRAEVLSALISVLALALLCVKLFVQAAQRLGHILRGSKAPIHVEGHIVFVAEAITLSCNLFIAVVLTKGNSSLNVRALRAHVIADSVENLVVLFAGFLMWQMPSLNLMDPILTLVIVVLIVVLNFGIARESVNVLLQAAPAEVDMERDVLSRLRKVEGVRGVGASHVWTLTSGSVIGSAVVFADEREVEIGMDAVERIRKEVGLVFEKAGVDEVTVQVCREEKDEFGMANVVSEVDETSSDDVVPDEGGYKGYGVVATEEELV